MAISQELLDLLVCPVCKMPIELTVDEKGLRCAPGAGSFIQFVTDFQS